MKNLTINKAFLNKKIVPVALSLMMGTSMIGFTGCTSQKSEEGTVKSLEKEGTYLDKKSWCDFYLFNGGTTQYINYSFSHVIARKLPLKKFINIFFV